MVCWFPAGCLLKSSLTRIDFGDTSDNFLREFSFSSLLKEGETKFYDSGFTIVAPLWMRRKMKVEMTKVRLQLINCGSKPRLPIDQINDCQIQHKCPPPPTPSTPLINMGSWYFSIFYWTLQSIRPNEVPVGGGGRYHWYTPNYSWTPPQLDTKQLLWHKITVVYLSDLYCPFMR